MIMRIYYSLSGWLIDTSESLSDTQLQLAINYHFKIMKQRWPGLSKEKKEVYGEALKGLNVNTLKQNLINKYPYDKEKTIFKID